MGNCLCYRKWLVSLKTSAIRTLDRYFVRHQVISKGRVSTHCPKLGLYALVEDISILSGVSFSHMYRTCSMYMYFVFCDYGKKVVKGECGVIFVNNGTGQESA